MALPASKAAALLAFVAHRCSPVRRAEVAALLWPDADDRGARNSLRQLLSSIGDGPLAPLLARDHTAVWATVASDIQAFAAAVAEGRLGDAVAQYQGRLMDGFELADAGEFGSWVASERADVESRWRRTCLTVIEQHESEGRHGQALELGERLLRADPLDEVALRHAVQAAAASGDGHGARRRFASFRETLASELGLEPESTTLALMDALRATPEPNDLPVPNISDYRSRAVGSALTALAPRLRSQHRIIGREKELADLVELIMLEDTRLLTLLAPGGMGKTTLAAAVVDEVGQIFADGVVVVPLDRVAGPDALTNALVGACGLGSIGTIMRGNQFTGTAETAVQVGAAPEDPEDQPPLAQGWIVADNDLTHLTVSTAEAWITAFATDNLIVCTASQRDEGTGTLLACR